MRVGMADLEMSNLKADFGIILCGCIKEYEGKLATFRLDDTKGWEKRRDGTLGRMLRDEIEKYDIICTWNGARFDIPFLNSRLILQGMRPLAPFKHIDLLYTSRFKLCLHSNRLDAVSQYFETKTSKTHLDGRRWLAALAGDRSAMNYIVKHCEHDVKVMEEVYTRIKSQIRMIKTH